MSNSARGLNSASISPKRHSAIDAMHQQAAQQVEQKARRSNQITGGCIGDGPMPAPRDESEVSREVSHLMHAVDELHLAIAHLEDRLMPVMAAMPPTAADESVTASTASPLGGILQRNANSVEAAISRMHAILNAIRV